jgi:hypothetical protein
MVDSLIQTTSDISQIEVVEEETAQGAIASVHKRMAQVVAKGGLSLA